MPQQDFEKLLQEYLPDIWKLNNIGKLDEKVWKAIYAMVDFQVKGLQGKIEVHYQNGKINHLTISERVI